MIIDKARFGNLPDGTDAFKFLASAGFSESDLSELCVEEAEVVGINNLDTDTVNVKYNGITTINVPVIVHTDEGCYASRFKDSEEIDPQGYFKGAARLFPVTKNSYFVKWNTALNYWSSQNNYTGNIAYPTAYVLVNTETKKPVAVIGVRSIEVGDNSGDINRTYKLLFGLHHQLRRNGARVLSKIEFYDVRTGELAQVLNQAIDEIVDADYGEVWTDYAHLFAPDPVNHFPGAIRMLDEHLTDGYSNFRTLNGSNSVVHPYIQDYNGSDKSCLPAHDVPSGWQDSTPDPTLTKHDATASCTGSYSWRHETAKDLDPPITIPPPNLPGTWEVVYGEDVTYRIDYTGKGRVNSSYGGGMNANYSPVSVHIFNASPPLPLLYGRRTVTDNAGSGAVQFSIELNTGFEITGTAYYLKVGWENNASGEFLSSYEQVYPAKSFSSLLINGFEYRAEGWTPDHGGGTGRHEIIYAISLPHWYYSGDNNIFNLRCFEIALAKDVTITGVGAMTETLYYPPMSDWNAEFYSPSPLNVQQKGRIQELIAESKKKFLENGGNSLPTYDKYYTDFSMVLVPYDFRELAI